MDALSRLQKMQLGSSSASTKTNAGAVDDMVIGLDGGGGGPGPNQKSGSGSFGKSGSRKSLLEQLR